MPNSPDLPTPPLTQDIPAHVEPPPEGASDRLQPPLKPVDAVAAEAVAAALRNLTNGNTQAPPEPGRPSAPPLSRDRLSAIAKAIAER